MSDTNKCMYVCITNGDVTFLWESGKFDHCKIGTLEQIDTRYVRLIRSTKRMFVPNLVKICSCGTSGQTGENNFLETFICLFTYLLSEQRGEQTIGRILTLMALAQKMQDRARMSLLGVRK